MARIGAAVAGVLAVGALAVPVPAQAAATPQCGSADLAAAYKGGDAGMSHVYGRIVLTNVSDRACRTGGYGGLSYVGGGDGTQVGAAADRDDTTPVRSIVLQPGQRVKSKVSETSYGPYPRKRCQPTEVDGFRVYVPNSTRATFIAHPTTGCANTAIHLLSHQAFRRP